MKIKFILPALTEAHGQFWRPIKYSLFPPLGLATLAGYLNNSDEAVIQDEHVEPLNLNDSPDLVVIQVYITSAYRAYEISDHYREKGITVILGGLHVTALPNEALQHADSIVLGPAEKIWGEVLDDFRNNRLEKIYFSNLRTLKNQPPVRRDLIKREFYLVPNSLVISRGCPHSCDFCYKTSFFRGGKSFYTYTTDQALSEIEILKGKHLFFLDDNIFGNPALAFSLFSEMKGMGRVWQGAATVASLQNRKLLQVAADSGLKSLFIGFETLKQEGLARHNKQHNRTGEYEKVIKTLHDYGIMINASFVFGLDQDDPSVFRATAEWAIAKGIETVTFHILTPYPGTPLYQRLEKQQRILHHDWNLYDTRHAVFRHPVMSSEAIEAGYQNAYSYFYKWTSILKSAAKKEKLLSAGRHIAYTGGWKKAEPVWNFLIRLKRLNQAVPPLERVLKGYD
ncbi:B12-binding domain-containing radical SAM protei n [Desulfonema ishimotonii]|uniref:B12-binding domain-containing radical SAM protei n n=2 Tax=Desulfonema ishimotonii TaxID=45657 RepID=A0A401G2Q1_9BACT|nr:B12-binding domain-containing radical SAM protei n [Desulfonema ishimotonii]